MNIYEKCPTLETENYVIRLFHPDDLEDLLKVYSDKNALPFFNSDNCHGDNFFYDTKEKMEKAFEFWKMSYENGWFVRLSICDKKSATIIGTAELCIRVSEDAFNNTWILPVDVRSDYEKAEILYEIFAIVSNFLLKNFPNQNIITKVPLYAVERIKAVTRDGFSKSENFLIGTNGFAYDGYWIK
ncbi:MAG: GNAT family N-acetyltransferase [Spirochaetales bacterium]|nr:GNAT family N-acetyltransferase [Spirochaetales bacterium]